MKNKKLLPKIFPLNTQQDFSKSFASIYSRLTSTLNNKVDSNGDTFVFQSSHQISSPEKTQFNRLFVSVVGVNAPALTATILWLGSDIAPIVRDLFNYSPNSGEYVGMSITLTPNVGAISLSINSSSPLFVNLRLI